MAGRFDAILDRTYGGLQLWQWMALAALLLASLLVGFLFRKLATFSLRARYHVPGMEFSQSSKRGTRRAVAVLVATGIWTLALPALVLPSHAYIVAFRIVQLVATLAAVWLLASLWNACCDVLANRSEGVDRRAEKLLVPLTRKFITTLIVVGGLLALLAVVGVNVMGIIAGLGIGGLAVALAAKDSLENLFGSLTILFDMPFALGDWVKIDKVEGVVEEINLRSTRIRTFEDSLITLPNSNLIKASVENFGARRSRRQRFFLRFAHDADPDRIELFSDALRQAINGVKGVLAEKTQVELNEVSEQSIGVLVNCFLEAPSAGAELRLRSKIMALALKLSKTHELRFAAAPPFPQPESSAETVLPKVE